MESKIRVLCGGNDGVFLCGEIYTMRIEVTGFFFVDNYRVFCVLKYGYFNGRNTEYFKNRKTRYSIVGNTDHLGGSDTRYFRLKHPVFYW